MQSVVELVRLALDLIPEELREGLGAVLGFGLLMTAFVLAIAVPVWLLRRLLDD